MTSLLALWMLKSSAVLAIAWVGTRLLHRAQAAQRHTLWMLALQGSVLLAFAPLVPSRPAVWALEMPFDSIAIVPLEIVAANRPTVAAWNFAQVLLGVWLFGAGGLVLRLGAAHVRVWRASAKMRRALVSGQEVFLCEEVEGPYTMGLFRSRIVLPASARAWSSAHLRAVLAHEQAHARRRDCLAQLFVDVYAAISWPNPLAWVARRQLAMERELSADEAVLAQGTLPSEYASLLVQHARQGTALAVAMASPSSLPMRIERILAERQPVPARALRAAAIICIAGAVTVLGCDMPGPHSTVDFEGVAPLVRGDMDPLIVRTAFDNAASELRQCYEEALAETPDLRVSTTVNFIVASNGVPQQVRLQPIDGARDLAPCLMGVVLDMRFAPPRDGREVSIAYLIELHPKEAAEGEGEATEQSRSEQGRLDPKLIKNVIQENREGIRGCYERELQKHHTLSGTIKTHFIIGVNGSVTLATVKESTLHNRAVEDCIAHELEKMTFPKPAGGGVVIVNYPFMFQAQPPEPELKTLNRDHVLNVVKPMLADVRRCATSNHVTGVNIIAKWTISPDGTVDDVSVSWPGGAGGAAATCVIDTLEQMRFPSYTDNTRIPVTFPFPTD